MSWWSRLWRRGRLEEQLEKELRFHLDQHASDLISRGDAPEQAQRRARLALGGPGQVKEKCRDARGTRWAEELLQDISYTLRTFRQKPGFVAITLLILALGIGATTVMFTVINSVLLRPLPFPEPDRLVILHGFMKDLGEFWGFSYPDLKDLKHEIRSANIAGWTFSSGTITAPREAEHVEGREISAELFAVLGVVPAYGRSFRPYEDQPGATPVAIISYGLWTRRFASDRAVPGKKLIFDGKAYEIVGVAPSGFQLSGEAEVYTPLGQSTRPQLQNREARFIQVIGRLAPGATLDQIQAELTLISRHLAEEYPKSNAGLNMRIHPLLDELVSDVRGTLWLPTGRNWISAADCLRKHCEFVSDAGHFPRAGTRHACRSWRKPQPACASMHDRERHFGALRRPSRHSRGSGKRPSVCRPLARHFATCGRDPYRLAGALFWSGRFSFMRPLFRINTGITRSLAQTGRSAARRRADCWSQIVSSAQLVRRLGDRARLRNAGLGGNARPHSVDAVFS